MCHLKLFFQKKHLIRDLKDEQALLTQRRGKHDPEREDCAYKRCFMGGSMDNMSNWKIHMAEVI